MTHFRRIPAATSLIGVCAIATLLAGCTPVSEKLDELHRFAEAVRDLPFVTDVSTTSNQPLPFSLTTAMTIVLAPGTDRADIDELNELTCSVAAKTSPAIALDYTFASGAVLAQDDLYRCWTLPVAFVELLPVLTPRETEFSRVEWTESSDDDGDALEIVVESAADPEGSTVASSVALGGELLAALADNGFSVALTTRGMSIPDGSLADARASAALAADLVARFGAVRFDAQSDEGIFVELSTDVPGSTDAVRAYLANVYPEVVVKAVVDATDAVGGSAPDQDVLDAATVVRDSGLAISVTTSDTRISVSTASLAANVEILRLLTSHGLEAVDVNYSTTLDGGAAVYAKPGRVALTEWHLDDVEVLAVALNPTGKLGSISYEPGSIKVYLDEEFGDDPAAVKQFTKIMRDALATGMAGDYRFVELDNKPVDGAAR